MSLGNAARTTDQKRVKRVIWDTVDFGLAREARDSGHRFWRFRRAKRVKRVIFYYPPTRLPGLPFLAPALRSICGCFPSLGAGKVLNRKSRASRAPRAAVDPNGHQPTQTITNPTQWENIR